MKTLLADKVVVITGGGGGIGRATALALAEQGARIALCGGHNIEKLKKTVSLVKNAGADVFDLPGDLTDNSFISSCIQQIHQRFNAIDVLINNAGIAINKSFEATSAEELDHIYKINVKAPFILCQQVLPYLRRSKCPAIVNIASVVAHKGYPNQAAYAASKHAILGFSKSLANEVYLEGIRVHTLCPGGVYTEMVKLARPDLSPEGMIMPEEIARTILFLLEQRGNAVIDEINIRRMGKPPYDG